jgi:hypothetical protein
VLSPTGSPPRPVVGTPIRVRHSCCYDALGLVLISGEIRKGDDLGDEYTRNTGMTTIRMARIHAQAGSERLRARRPDRVPDLIRGGRICRGSSHIRVGSGRLRGLYRDRFIDRLTHCLAEVNATHPSREGNGRTHRVFLQQLAEDAGYHIDWRTLDPPEDIDASPHWRIVVTTKRYERSSPSSSPHPARSNYPGARCRNPADAAGTLRDTSAFWSTGAGQRPDARIDRRSADSSTAGCR